MVKPYLVCSAVLAIVTVKSDVTGALWVFTLTTTTAHVRTCSSDVQVIYGPGCAVRMTFV